MIVSEPIHETRHINRLRHYMAAFAVLLASWLTAVAQEGEEERKPWNFLEQQLTLSADYETPHTKWAKPYYKGPVRVLFFAPWFQGSTDGREIVELLQRFDIDGQVAYVMGNRLVGDGHPDWYGNDSEAGSKRAAAFMQSGVDAIVISQLTLESIPAPIRDQIRSTVMDGAGLVLIGENVIAFEGTEFSKTATGQISRSLGVLGNGRVAVLPSRSKLEYRLGWETELDYQLEQRGRVVFWAAKREPDATIELGVTDFDRVRLPSEIVTIDASGLDPSATISVAVLRWDGVRTELPAISPSTSRIALPALRAGAYHIDCIATVNGKTVAWDTAPFNVRANRSVESVTLERDWSEPGESASGTIKIVGDAATAGPVKLRLVDSHHRILLENELPAANEIPFTLEIPSWAPMLSRIEAVLMDGTDELSSAYAYLRVTRRNRDQFNFLMWNAPTGDLAPYGIENMANHGVTMFLQGGPPPLAFSAYKTAYVPYAASFRASSHTTTAMLDPDTGILKNGCVHDPDAMQRAVAASVDAYRSARESGVFAYSLGDENAVRASCLGPHCLQAYQEYLAKTYVDVSALNASWGSSYASFADVRLLDEGPLPAPDAPQWFTEYYAERDTLHRTDNEGAKDAAQDRQVAFGDINDEIRALQQGNFARWYDRQAFQNESYLHWCKLYQEAFRKLDPHALTGFEGTDSFTIRKHTTRSRQGGDLDAFVRELDYYGSYEGPGNEVLRSIAPNGFPMGSWIGYTPDVEELLFKYWQQVADRMNTIQWWRWDNLEGYNGFLAPNLSPFPATKELYEDTQVVRDGLGKLIMNSDMHDDGIAMLYSMPSTYIAHFDGNDTYGLYKRDHDRWHQLLHDEGLQFRYVTDRMLRLGEFEQSKFKVLILPLAFAMDPTEAEVVRNFVRGGGTVIVDLRPALYDGHCKPLDQGLLNDVFGIRQTGNRAAREIDRMSISGELAGQPLSMRWGNWHGKDIYPQMKVDPNVELTTGKGMGEAAFIHYWTGLKAPQCIVNEFGSGRAILLNFSVFDAPCATLLRGLLGASGVKPAIAVTESNGARAKGVEVSRWQNGDDQLVILLSQDAHDLNLSLDAAKHVYDVKKKAYIGSVDSFSVSLQPNRAGVYALLSEMSSPAKIGIGPTAQRGSVISATIEPTNASGKRTYTLRLSDPSGRLASWIASPVIVDDQPIAVPLPIAHNESTGTWKLEATELYSGELSSAQFEISQ